MTLLSTFLWWGWHCKFRFLEYQDWQASYVIVLLISSASHKGILISLCWWHWRQSWVLLLDCHRYAVLESNARSIRTPSHLVSHAYSMNKAKALLLQISFFISTYLFIDTHFHRLPPLNCRPLLHWSVQMSPSPSKTDERRVYITTCGWDFELAF